MKKTLLSGMVVAFLSACAAESPRDRALALVGEGLPAGTPLLYRKVQIPGALLRTSDKRPPFGGDVRVGDLDNDGRADLLVFRNSDKFKPCFLGAFTLEGEVLWKVGDGGSQPERPGPVAIFDIDADGKNEVVCFWAKPGTESTPHKLDNVVVQIRDGATGKVKKEAAPREVRERAGEGANWCHQRILVANLRGTKTPQDFVIKLGDTIVALNNDLEALWTYAVQWNDYGRCSAYIPCVGDINGDGRDEVSGGYFLLDPDGKPRWEKQWGSHMDSVAITEWDDGKVRALCSGWGHVIDENGREILGLGKPVVPHGQELRCADFDPRWPGPEMVIRNNGHHTDAILVNNRGEVVAKFNINESPNNTGMEAVLWNGPGKTAVLCNGGVLWTGNGRKIAELPGLPKPRGDSRMGWYHCIPADVCSDAREEVVIYNPWDEFVAVYTPAPFDRKAYRGYRPGPRQYNPRLMD